MALLMISLANMIAFSIFLDESAVITTWRSSLLLSTNGLANDLGDMSAPDSSDSVITLPLDFPSFTDPFPRIASFAPLSSWI